MATNITWIDPPQAVTRGKYDEVLDQLKRHPGRWARIARHRSGGNAVGFRRSHPGYEATTRKRSDGHFDLYARWVGNGDA